jgi:hypothetical protein
MPPGAFLSPAARFASIVNGLFLAIGVRRDAGFLAAPLAMLLCHRLGHLRSRITRLAARIAAGKGSGVPRCPRTPRNPDAPPAPRRPPHLVPRDHGWMLRLMPEAAAAGSQLQHLLAQPEMAEFAAHAPQLGRLLRPLCRALGVQRPDYLRPASRPRKPRQRPPERPRPPRAVAAQRLAAWPGLNRPYRYHGPVTNPWRHGPPPPGPLSRRRPDKPA